MDTSSKDLTKQGIRESGLGNLKNKSPIRDPFVWPLRQRPLFSVAIDSGLLIDLISSAPQGFKFHVVASSAVAIK